MTLSFLFSFPQVDSQYELSIQIVKSQLSEFKGPKRSADKSGHIIKAYRWRFIYCKILWTKVIRNNAEKWISFSLCCLCSDWLETMLKMIIQNVNIIFKLVFPTNHVFDHTDRIVNCIDKSFWQKSLALTKRSFCIQLEAYSSNESREKRQNVFRRFNA